MRPMLEMHIGKYFIDDAPLDYSGMETVREREEYQQRIALELYYKNIWAVRRKGEPHFFVQVSSAGNYRDEWGLYNQ